MENISYNGKKYILFDDSNLYKYGTLCRGLSRYLKIENGMHGYNEYVFSGDVNSFEPHCLIQGIMDNLPDLKIKLFLLGSSSDLPYKYPDTIMKNIVLYDKSHVNLDDLINVAEKYVADNLKRKYIYFSPDENVRNIFILNSLKSDPQFNNLILKHPDRLFIVVYNGTVLSVLLHLLPYTHFVVISINPNFKLDDIPDQSQENISRIQVVETYDFNTDDYYNEMLRVVDERGKNGDYIFLPYLLHNKK